MGGGGLCCDVTAGVQSRLRTTEWASSSSCSSLSSITAVLSPSWSSPTSASPHGQINREKQKDKMGERESRRAFWSDDAADFLGYDVCVVCVGTGDSPAFVEAAAEGSAGSTAAASFGATETEAVGMGRSGSGGMP